MKSSILLTLLFVVACNNNSESSLNSKFADRPHVELVAEKISVDELLEPGFVVRTDDYLIYFGESGKNRDLFYVYTTDDLKFAYSFGSTGRASNEFLLTSPVYQLKGNNFLVLDSVGRKLFRYLLGEDQERLLEVIKMDLPMGQPIQEMVMLNDTTAIFSLTEESGSYLYSYDLSANRVIDKISMSEYFRGKLGQSYNPEMNSFSIGGTLNNSVYIAHTYLDEISKVRLDDDFSFGDDRFVFEDKNPNFKDMMIYNGYMRHDDGYLAVTRVGREPMKMSPLNPLRDFRFNIEIYDRDLTPIALLKPGQNILRFEIDIDRGYIYSWDVLNGFEHICRYKIDIKQL